MKRLPKAVVVVPTYKERENVRPLIERISAVRRSVREVEIEVLFVDDSSPDGTGEEVKQAMGQYEFVHLLTRPKKEGIGRAFLDGFRFALDRFSPTVVVQMDGDLQHPPEVIPELVHSVLEGADVAIASRKVEGGKTVGWSRRRNLLSWGANWLARIVLGLDQKDVSSGFKAYSREMVEELTSRRLTSSSFSYQEETLLVAKRAGKRVVEIPFTFTARKAGKTKFKTADILRFLRAILAMRYKAAE
ncbi:MAG: polyprenol monophosphomannose synthase [Thaumarchaeota archaeon]|nr:MAG: polyprenol monophosphomannose synthase [Nitrososphaerota archaeon]